jgi:hypothetical protein
MDEHLSSQKVSNLNTLSCFFSSAKGFFRPLFNAPIVVWIVKKKHNMVVKSKLDQCLVASLIQIFFFHWFFCVVCLLLELK